MRLYKHINNTDIAFEIIKKFYVVEKELWKFKVMWWNIVGDRVPGRTKECMRIEQRISIPKDIWQKEWKLYDIQD